MGLRWERTSGTDKPKRQFSKMHVVFADLLVLFVYVSNLYLAYKGLQQISDLAITIVTVYGAFATGGYFTLNAIRDNSLNKYGALRREERNEYGED